MAIPTIRDNLQSLNTEFRSRRGRLHRRAGYRHAGLFLEHLPALGG